MSLVNRHDLTRCVLRALSVTIDRSAIIHNYGVAKQLAGAASVFAVIKADAYGHGAAEVATALSMADAFAVVTTGEAIALREAGVKQAILVMQGPTHVSQLASYIEHDLWASIHDEHQLGWLKCAPQLDQLSLWFKIDTGMGRLGLSLAQAELELESEQINWMGMLTHLASADDRSCSEVTAQAQRFAALQSRFPHLLSSIANSAGIMAWPDLRAHWVRPGLMLYGSTPFDGTTAASENLKPAMRVTAPLISVKKYAEGASIGYAHQYHCPEDMLVGHVGAGYGDGLPRVLDTTATLLVHETPCQVIGRVSMDSIAIDLRSLNSVSTTVKPGDEVEIWGPDHPVELLAAAAGTISYELITQVRGNRLYL
ncbi:MAG: alanine racemase [Granulosicoccaceae bacterium]